MKKARKLLALVLAVIMLFSVMSTGMVVLATNVTVGSQTGNDGYETTDDVIICVPETVYMDPVDGESTTGQYFVNNTVSSSGVVTLEASKTNTRGYISIYAPGSTAFKFTVDAVAGSGIGNPVIVYSEDGTTPYEGNRYNNTEVGGTTGYAAWNYLDLYLNGAGISHGSTALIEWKVTIYYGDSDTTGTTYYAYTTLYAPMRSVGAVAEAKRSDNGNNEISSWITGITSVGSQTTVTHDRASKEATGYFTYDPLWTKVFGVGSYESADDYVTVSDAKYVHASATDGAEYTFSAGYKGYLSIDASRYANTNQVPNFYIGSDVLRVNSGTYHGLRNYYVWSILGTGNETTTTDEDYNPAESAGWTELLHVEKGSTGRNSWNPDYAVSAIEGKYLHIGSQGQANYLSDYNYSNAYVSVVFSTTDKSDLRAAVIQATGLDETKYTKNSWSGATVNVIEEFHEALRNAAQVLGTPGAAQGIIDSALNTLRTKMNALMVTIKFDAGTNGGMFIDSETVKEYNIRFGTKTTVNVTAALLNYFNAVMADGYVLAGWSTDKSDPTTASLESVTVTFGDTLYAHYKKDISVDFNYLSDITGKTNVINETLTIYNGSNKALDANVPDMDDVGIYAFAGWTTDPASTEGAMLGDTIDGVTNSTAYYATYLKTLTLNLDANGGTFDVDSVIGGVGYNYDLSQTTGVATVILPEEEPAKAGHGFEGWEINGVVYQPGDEVEFAGTATTATATAVWGVEKYDVTFNYKDANGKDVSIKEKIEYGKSAVAPEVPAYHADSTRHYKFTGWDVAFDNITGDTVVTAEYNLGEGHSYTTEGTPNCDETVDVIYSCVCGYSYTMTVEAGHKYEVTDSKDATCEDDGYITYVCQRDSSHTYTDLIKATGHSYENTEYVAPTCTEDGYYISGTCGTCGAELAGKTIPALGHDMKTVTEATCKASGLKECSRCEHTEVIPQLDHDYTAVTTPATCTEDGKIVYTCSSCGDSYETVITSSGHSYVSIVIAPTCTSKGYTSITCTICGDSSHKDYVDALGHDYTDTVVEPTCTKQGYTAHTCSVCNYSYKTDYVDATGHDYSTVTVVEPTCTKRGYTLHECTKCNSSYKTDYTDATGHDYVYVETVNPTGTQNGYDLYKCSLCGHSYKDTIYSDERVLVSYTLYGDDGKVVAGATIVLTNIETGAQITITTDLNGYFTQIINNGTYSVNATKIGYKDVSGKLYVDPLEGSFDMELSAMPCKNCSCLCHADTLWGRIYRLLIKMFSIFGKIYCCDDCDIW